MNRIKIESLSAEIASDLNNALDILERVGHKIKGLERVSREEKCGDFEYFLRDLLKDVQRAGAAIDSETVTRLKRETEAAVDPNFTPGEDELMYEG